MDSYTVIVIIFGILTLGVLLLVYFINQLVALQNKVLHSYSSISDYLDIRKEQLIEIVDFVNEKLEHEDVYVNKINKMVSSIGDLSNVNNGLKMSKKTDNLIKQFFELENVYSFLKKDKNYYNLKEVLLLNNDRIRYSVEAYNDNVKLYNKYKENRLIKFFDKFIHFKDYDYWDK